VNTLNFALGKLAASVEVTVAGAASSVTTDPDDLATVQPLSDNKITVTVTDDEGVLVGATPIQILKVGGEGLVENVKATTDNGVTTFNYTAPFEGQAVFRIRAGHAGAQVEQVLRLNIGDPGNRRGRGRRGRTDVVGASVRGLEPRCLAR
jgi:hypothetical protein